MKLFYSIILSLMIFNISLAQNSSATFDKELKHGIEFQVGSLLTLTNFGAYTFSYRYIINPESGVRIGLLTAVNNNDEDIVQQIGNRTISPQNYSHYYNYKLSLQYLYNVTQYKSFTMMIGGGPFISISNSDSKDDNLYTTYIRRYVNSQKTTSFGLDFIFGVEYKLTDNFMFSAEYGLSINKGTEDINYESSSIFDDPASNSVTTEKGKRNIFGINSSTVKLGLSVFF